MGTEGFDWLKKGLKSRSESEDLDDAVLVAAIDWVFRFASIRFQWFQYSTSHLVRNSWRSGLSQKEEYSDAAFAKARIVHQMPANKVEDRHSGTSMRVLHIILVTERAEVPVAV
ncbi:hypothetical protein CASFOL_028915 [Castilleja foliolosa]|uniref:Uncharacterized protein n=1 Tax=Castilleja foliolosa TaxID=1961234 RepID=A0ABD3CDE6_9LAMI